MCYTYVAKDCFTQGTQKLPYEHDTLILDITVVDAVQESKENVLWVTPHAVFVIHIFSSSVVAAVFKWHNTPSSSKSESSKTLFDLFFCKKNIHVNEIYI